MNGLDNQQCNDEGLRELALFAGAGGGILGGHLLGWRTVCAVEYNAYARSVLLARQNDGTLPPFPVWDDVRTFDGKPWRGLVDVVSGGFPCQDISAAGKGAGLEGERSGLWSEFARIIGEVRPKFVYVENSPMLTSRGLGRVLGDLAELGFDAEWGIVSAADTGAPHLRERIWILANAVRIGQLGQESVGIDSHNEIGATEAHREEWREITNEIKPGSEDDADIMRQGLSLPWEKSPGTNGKQIRRSPTANRGWPSESGLVRMVHGVPNRMDRIKALGNAQVSRVAATAWRILSDEN